jgi:hypothetical protein
MRSLVLLLCVAPADQRAERQSHLWSEWEVGGHGDQDSEHEPDRCA